MVAISVVATGLLERKHIDPDGLINDENLHSQAPIPLACQSVQSRVANLGKTDIPKTVETVPLPAHILHQYFLELAKLCDISNDSLWRGRNGLTAEESKRGEILRAAILSHYGLTPDNVVHYLVLPPRLTCSS